MRGLFLETLEEIKIMNTIIYKSDATSKLKRNHRKYKLGTEIHCADGVVLVRVRKGFEVRK